MALGFDNDNGGNGSRRRNVDQTYYSRLRITDQASKLSLRFRFANGMLVFTIAKLKDENNFEYEDLNEIWITPTKAKILLDGLDSVILSDNKHEGIGITSGLKETVSAIVFHNQDRQFTGLSIGKVDGSGNWVSKSTIEFNTDYHYFINWDNIESNKFSQHFCNQVEFNMIYDLLDSFAKNMAGGLAYTMADFTRFDTARAAGRLKPIYEKLGIEWGGSNNYNRGDGNNFFNNNTRGGTAEHKDFDEVMEELPFN